MLWKASLDPRAAGPSESEGHAAPSGCWRTVTLLTFSEALTPFLHVDPSVFLGNSSEHGILERQPSKVKGPVEVVQNQSLRQSGALRSRKLPTSRVGPPWARKASHTEATRLELTFPASAQAVPFPCEEALAGDPPCPPPQPYLGEFFPPPPTMALPQATSLRKASRAHWAQCPSPPPSSPGSEPAPHLAASQPLRPACVSPASLAAAGGRLCLWGPVRARPGPGSEWWPDVTG